MSDATFSGIIDEYDVMLDYDSQHKATLLGLSRTGWLVVFVIVASLAAILIPAIQSARREPAKMTSNNNLKQIGLAFHNYADTYKRLPPGAFKVYSGDGHLGWTYAIHPFIEASPLYSQVDSDYAWDSPENRYRFLQPVYVYRNPGVRDTFTSEGYPVTHYLGNPAFFHLNSSRTLKDATAGLSHAWFAGEVAGDYQPWGYPFNWRTLTAPLNASPASYGRPTADGALLLMADGSVQFVANEIDPRVLHTWTSIPPLPELKWIQKPERSFNCVRRTLGYRWDYHILSDSTDRYGSRPGVSAFLSPERVEFVELGYNGKFFEGPFEIRDIHLVVSKYPQAESFLLPMELNDDVAATIVGMNLLERLHVSSVNVSTEGLRTLAQLPSLRVLRIDATFGNSSTQEDLDQLRASLPNCDVRVRR